MCKYMARFAMSIQRVDNPNDYVVVMALRSDLKGSVCASLVRLPVKTLAEGMMHAQKEMHAKDMLAKKLKMASQGFMEGRTSRETPKRRESLLPHV